MNKVKTDLKNKSALDILKRLVARMEKAAVDIHDMRFDLKSMNMRMSGVEDNTEIMKVDVEEIKQDMKKMDKKLNERLTLIADLITVQLGKKIVNVKKRVGHLEHAAKAS